MRKVDVSEPNRRRRHRLNHRLRAEWIAGAEEEWRERTGRPMTGEELERMLSRYPGTCSEIWTDDFAGSGSPSRSWSVSGRSW
jgi:hypothetical protein